MDDAGVRSDDGVTPPHRDPTPSWLDLDEYPFTPRWFATPAGAMHYIDEGTGTPIVFVHGNPTWSFQFRNVFKELDGSRRCIAADHLGFGLSDKPRDFSYLPIDHARNFACFMESLDLRNVTLVVGDWGGPIGLSWALDNPDRVTSLVITNTWMWSVRSDWYYQAFSGIVGGPIGRQLIRRRNFFASSVVSNIGTWVQRVAQDWLVLQLTHSGTALGIVTGLQFLPTLLFSLLGGSIADRFDKRKILALTNAGGGVAALTLGTLVLMGNVQIWQVYLLAFGLGFASAIDAPVRQAFSIELVGPDDLQNAVSLNSANFNGGRLIGPALSGLMIN
ncbi:MAG: alpha/beta fold hydrolase, partial [Actinobacteria bacterium]|nr:alpha/beta fold hydrolase [Actinomycetota bacterium]